MCTSQTGNKKDICSDISLLNNHFQLFLFLSFICIGKDRNSAFFLFFFFFYFPLPTHSPPPSLHLPFSIPDRFLLCSQGWLQMHNLLALSLSPLLTLQRVPSCADKNIRFQVEDLFKKVFLSLQRNAKREQSKIS